MNGDAYPAAVSQKVAKNLPVSFYSPMPGFKAQELKAPVTYCDHALSVVCRPFVRLLTFSTSSLEPLCGFLLNLAGMKY